MTTDNPRITEQGVATLLLVGPTMIVEKFRRTHPASNDDDQKHIPVLVVQMPSELDRLGRNLRHLINAVHDPTGRGVGLKVLTGTWRCHRYHDHHRQAGLRHLRDAGGIRA